MPAAESLNPPVAEAIARLDQAISYSSYAERVAAADPALLGDVAFDPAHPLTRTAMLGFIDRQGIADEAALRRGLRRLRAGTMVALMQRDLAGSANLAEVTQCMTALADLALERAITWFDAAMRAQHGIPRGELNGEPQSVLAVGMGKLGGGELNVSSDIDLVFVYPEEGETDGARKISNHEYFIRLGQRVIRALDDITEDGRVFRVDMRLRPNGEAGPIACGFDMLEEYFVVQGREWERYAWIKARAANTGDGSAAYNLQRIVRPFVFRKYLDFDAFGAMRALHAQIREEVARRELADHIKLGPGGIREIEFIAQVFQLIRGGRDPGLQIRPTLQVLDALAERALLPADAVRALARAYDYLRRLEHRLQYLDDRQTHELPREAAAQSRVALAMGERDYTSLLDTLARHRNLVSSQFEAIFAGRDSDTHPLTALWTGDREAMRDGLATLGYADAGTSAGRLIGLRQGSRYRQLPETSRTRLDRLLPSAVALAAASSRPDLTLARLLDFFEAICRRSAYLALLDESRDALERVADMLAASQWAAQYLTRHPLLLDELLDARLLSAEHDGPAFESELRAQLAGLDVANDSAGADAERQMDVLREAHHAALFRLLAQDLAGALTVERVADHLSDLADRVISVTLDVCWKPVRERYGADLPLHPGFAVVAYGKLGGKELGYASDLDLVFLYDDSHERALEAYTRLAQRLNSWLNTTTPAGSLFDTDNRLRPDGEKGLFVNQIAAFRDYQKSNAWLWEHQALTRARYCAGDARVGAEFEMIRHEILVQPRELAALAADISAMRGKMHAAHPNSSGRFDVKHDPGGMIDIEFVVQFLVLAHAHRHPELTANAGNIALLGIAGRLRLIDESLAGQVQDAYREYRRCQHAMRLNGAEFARVPTPEVASMRAAVVTLWHSVLGENEES